MILGQTPRAPVFSGVRPVRPVRPLFYQVVGSDPEIRKRVHEASDPLLQNAKLFLRAPLGSSVLSFTESFEVCQVFLTAGCPFICHKVVSTDEADWHAIQIRGDATDNSLIP